MHVLRWLHFFLQSTRGGLRICAVADLNFSTGYVTHKFCMLIDNGIILEYKEKMGRVWQTLYLLIL